MECLECCEDELSKKKHVKHYIWSKYLNSYPWITIFYFLSKFLARRYFFLQTLELMNDIWCVETCWNTICTLRIGMYTEKYFFLQFYMHASMSAKCADMPRQFLDKLPFENGKKSTSVNWENVKDKTLDFEFDKISCILLDVNMVKNILKQYTWKCNLRISLAGDF